MLFFYCNYYIIFNDFISTVFIFYVAFFLLILIFLKELKLLDRKSVV